jgi:prophage regulatory protein
MTTEINRVMERNIPVETHRKHNRTADRDRSPYIRTVTMQNTSRRTIRRPELRQIVPLGDTTIYEMEQRGEFPRRFYLTSRCVVWDLVEVEAWIEQRRRDSHACTVTRAPVPDVRRRKTRPVSRC